VHNRLFNEAIIKLTITPVGPILIKAGEGDADPTKPDMNFVRTIRDGKETVYLPGSSLKGVLRSHCERLARTVQNKKQLACDPLSDSSCGKLLEGKELAAAAKHARSCFVCQVFGNTSLASHFRIEDAYPDPTEIAPRSEERNGVAIDRVFGSVAVGPFNYETVTSGKFQTTIRIKNFTLAQIGLLALALRDLTAERVRVGFGKSRGLGVVNGHVDALTLRYPLCELKDGKFYLLGGRLQRENRQLVGVGEFAKDEGYGYPLDDTVPMPDGYAYVPTEWDEVEVRAPRDGNNVQWEALGRACVKKWRAEVEGGN
jgi:CRISPR-associated RAMP protein (TIGR02581 family)